ncbi:MAG: nucleoside deaminase [Clostridiales bacterium]|nr:nucleoside deaminase [Clostridiales bacterium]
MHEYWMKKAIDQASLSGEDVPVGAVLVKDGRLIASAYNCRERDNMPFAHAEILAMNQASRELGNRRLNGCTLYVTLEPCPMCAGAMMMACLDACVFGAFDKDYGCCGSLYALPLDERFSHRVKLIGGVLEHEAKEQLIAFFNTRREGR